MPFAEITLVTNFRFSRTLGFFIHTHKDDVSEHCENEPEAPIGV